MECVKCVCVWLKKGEWIGVLNVCLCLGCGGVGGVSGECVDSLNQGLEV